MDKAKELKIRPESLSRILSGKVNNPDILDDCLTELRERIEKRNAEVERINEQMKTHRHLQQLQGI